MAQNSSQLSEIQWAQPNILDFSNFENHPTIAKQFFDLGKLLEQFWAQSPEIQKKVWKIKKLTEDAISAWLWTQIELSHLKDEISNWNNEFKPKSIPECFSKNIVAMNNWIKELNNMRGKRIRQSVFEIIW